MSQAFAPFGLRPVAALGSHGNELRPYALPNGAACPDLAKGSPIKTNGGVVTSVGTGGGPLAGVAMGFAWIDGTTRRPVQQSWIPADTSSAGLWEGHSRPQVLVVDNPNAIFMVQADASISAGDVGLNFDVTASGGDVDTVMGVSRYTLDASTRTSALSTALKLVGLARIPDNNWDDPFPVVLVKLNSPILAQTSAF